MYCCGLLRDPTFFCIILCVAAQAVPAKMPFESDPNARQITIPRVEQMPNRPEPYLLRDWKQVARDFDELVFDFDRTGQHLPLIWWDTTHRNFPRDTFGLPSQVGTPFQGEGASHEAINTVAAVLGATLVGIDKSNQNGRNWVLMQESYYNQDCGDFIFLNASCTDTDGSFWYTLFPNVLMFQLISRYPGTGDMDNEMLTVANKWYSASYAMIEEDPFPNFAHTSFDLDLMQPVDNGRWEEPDAAAGIAWLEYMAYARWGQPWHLQGADWGLQFLEGLSYNPLYEVLLPFGTYLAARMNAELDRDYDVEKLLNWCFEPSDAPVGSGRPGWGIIADRWGDYDCHGLMGSVPSAYAFAMNTFDTAGALVPLARYDERFARAIGKWMLNLANSSRLFYANGLPDEYQSSEEWAHAYDTNYTITYEGLREYGNLITVTEADHELITGQMVSGTFIQTQLYQDGEEEILKEVSIGDHDQLEHIWRLNLPEAKSHAIYVHAPAYDSGDADSGFVFSYSTSAEGPYQNLFTINSSSSDWGQAYTGAGLPGSLVGPFYLKVSDTNRSPGNTSPDEMHVDAIYVRSTLDVSPYGMGDYLSSTPRGRDGVGFTTDFALYGASHVGILGAIVQPTNVERILQLDCLVTESFPAPAYPTYLYFNPYDITQSVQIDVGSESVDLYDVVSDQFLKQHVNEVSEFEIPPDSAVVLVLTPSGGQQSYRDGKFLVDDVVVDYHYHGEKQWWGIQVR